ncbi:RNA polymerase sigma factor (sigma-70 family) [Nakamurella sp. UYEF19]|uniref:sigma-70 family RNA polymerase sigma factor n=1 Tax=Nakamurella sp. UYEF19 TaxID=1756392 RepID=UPI003392DBD8
MNLARPPVQPPESVRADPTAEHVMDGLYRDHYASLVRIAALMTDSRQLAEEIVQDAFTELLVRQQTVEPGKTLAYLRKSVANRSKSALRRRRTVRNHRPEEPVAVAAAETVVLRAVGFDLLLAGIGRLPIRQRQVLVLRYYSGASIAETAAALGISHAAVTTSTHRALQALAPLKDDLR